jgi:Uma2 family endonuclease
MNDPDRISHHWSRGEYERMVDADVFPPTARLELLDGEILDMTPQKSVHASAVDLVEEALRACFSTGFYVRGQKPLALDDHSEPEPDVAVVQGCVRDYTGHHPRTAVLIVEVADSTLAFDRVKKATAYARNGIPEYWILNLRDRTLEVHGDPAGNAHAQRSSLTADEVICPLAAPGAGVKVADLLP